jgi:hypothetical protein
MDYFKQVTSRHVDKLLQAKLLQAFSKEEKSYIGIMKTIKQLHKKSQGVSHVTLSPPLFHTEMPETKPIIEIMNCTFSYSP